MHLQRTSPGDSVITGVCGVACRGRAMSPREKRLKSFAAAPNSSTNTSVHTQLLKTVLVLLFSKQAGGTRQGGEGASDRIIS